MSNPENTSTKKLSKVLWSTLRITLVFVIGFYAGATYIYNTQAIKPDQTAPVPLIVEKPKTEIDPVLLPFIQALNIQAEGLKVEFVDTLPAGQQFGEFDGTRTLKILRSGDATGGFTTPLAHEYLHYVWTYKLTQAEREALSASLNELYNSDSGMQQRMAWYRDKGFVAGTEKFSNELHSIYCTESSDGWLNQTVLDECNRWLSRGALSFQR